MPLENSKLPPRPEFPTLEDGTYQVQIRDISDHVGSNYKTKEPEDQYQFDLEVLDEENKGHVIKVWTSKKYSAAKEGRAESKLYTICNKVFGKVIPADELDLNDLIGKQLKIVVTRFENEAGYERNKVVSFLAAKKDLPIVTDEAASEESPKAESEAKESNAKDSDEINLDDIPF